MRLSVQNLSFAYRGMPVLKDLSFEAVPGEMTAIAGANAVGKSTLLKCIAGALKPQGKVFFDGAELRRLSEHQRSHMIGYMVQDNDSQALLTVFEVVLLGRMHALSLRLEDRELERVSAVLEKLRIAPLATRPFAQLSGGQRRMVSIAQTLVREPSVLILDEPTANLDMQNELEVLQLLRDYTREKGIVTLVTLHDLNVVTRFADKVVLLSGGKIYRQGAPREAITEESIAAAYGVKARIIEDQGDLIVYPCLSCASER